jgi:hypothetical protein
LLAPLVFAQDSEVLVSSPNAQNSTPTQGQQENKSTSTKATGRHRGPSQASIDACQSKSTGDACQVTSSHGTRSGICSYTQDKKYLFCKHNHKKAHPKAKPQDQPGT